MTSTSASLASIEDALKSYYCHGSIKAASLLRGAAIHDHLQTKLSSQPGPFPKP
jgi:hypothetical protein